MSAANELRKGELVQASGSAFGRKKRFCVLYYGDNKKLATFKSEDDFVSGGKAKDIFVLDGATIIEGKRESSEECNFKLNIASPVSRVVEFVAATYAEKQDWVIDVRTVLTTLPAPRVGHPRPSVKLQSSRATSRKKISSSASFTGSVPPTSSPTRMSTKQRSHAGTVGERGKLSSSSRAQSTNGGRSISRASTRGNAGGGRLLSKESLSNRNQSSTRLATVTDTQEAEALPWFIKHISRTASESVLQETGMNAFLVRESGFNKGAYTLSLFWNGDVKHHTLKPSKDNWYTLNGHTVRCSTLSEMIEFLRKEHGPPLNWSTPLPDCHISNVDGQATPVVTPRAGSSSSSRDAVQQGTPAAPSLPVRRSSVKTSSSSDAVQQGTSAAPSLPVRRSSVKTSSSSDAVQQGTPAAPSLPVRRSSVKTSGGSGSSSGGGSSDGSGNATETEPPKEMVVAVGSYTPPDTGAHGKIGLCAGDKMSVLLKDEGGWWFVRRDDVKISKGYEEGWVPSNFLAAPSALPKPVEEGLVRGSNGKPLGNRSYEGYCPWDPNVDLDHAGDALQQQPQQRLQSAKSSEVLSITTAASGKDASKMKTTESSTSYEDTALPQELLGLVRDNHSQPPPNVHVLTPATVTHPSAADKRSPSKPSSPKLSKEAAGDPLAKHTDGGNDSSYSIMHPDFNAAASSVEGSPSATANANVTSGTRGTSGSKHQYQNVRVADRGPKLDYENFPLGENVRLKTVPALPSGESVT